MDQSISTKCFDLKQSIQELEALMVETSQNGTQLPVSPTALTDVLERFSLWAGNLGALRRPNSRLSLDQRLLGAPEIHEQICQQLDDMAEAVEDLRDIILGDSPNRDLGAADELLDEEDTNGGQDQGETKAASEDEDGDEAHMILQVMSESIKTLFRIGMLVRKSGTRDRFRRALQMSSSTFPPIFDIDYVGQKYPKLRGRGHDIATNRLGSAIAKRRQFIKYGREHSARLATAEVAPKVEETPTPTFEETTPKIPEISLPAMSERVSSKATTLQVARFTRKLSAEELNEEPEDDKATVMTASTTTDNLASLKLPFLEDLSHDNGPFECPFCFTLQTFKTERSWKTHAFNDLKAYLCTVGGADCDDLLFGDRNTWFEHELHHHRSKYICTLCDLGPISSDAEFRSHIIQSHGTFGEEQLKSLAEASRELPRTFKAEDCPFCDDWATKLAARPGAEPTAGPPGSDVSISRFKRHVAMHQEQLAIFAVPRAVGGDNTASSGSAIGSNSMQDGFEDDSERALSHTTNEVNENDPAMEEPPAAPLPQNVASRRPISNAYSAGTSSLAACAVYISECPERANDLHGILASLGEVTLFKVVKTQIGKQYALAEFASAQGERAVLTASPILVGRWCLQVRTWRDFVGLSSSSSQAAADDAFGILQWACYTNTPKRATAVLDQGLIDINNQIRMSSKRLLLHDAAFYGSLDMVILLLHHDVDINGRDSMGQTPLILAAKAGDVEVASLLLSYGSDATLRDKSGWDALFYAAGQLASHDGMEDVIPELIAAGCDPNSKNPKSKMTPLTWAVTNGNEQMTEILLAAGCMVPVNLPGDTPIVLAAARGHAGIVEKLIQHGSDPSIRKSGQMEPLICAVKNGHEDVVSVLLAAGADLHWRDELGMTALMRAVQSGNVRIVEQLLQAGSSVYDVDDKNLTVLGYALNYGRSYRKANVLMIKKLLEAGADLNLAGRNGDYALHWAVRSMPREHNQGRLSASELERPDRWDQIGADQGPEAVVQVLIEHGASVNSRDKEGTTPLALAAERGLVRIAQVLLRAGADINSRNTIGRAPLSCAVARGSITMIRLLLEKGADVDSSDIGGTTPLSYAAEAGSEAIIRLLLEKGADVDSSDRGGRTPLSYASGAGSEAIIRLLLEKGADVDSSDRGGRTPLSYAVMAGFEAIIRLLLQRGADVNSCDVEGRTPFAYAKDKMEVGAADMLVKYGALANDRDGRPHTLVAAEPINPDPEKEELQEPLKASQALLAEKQEEERGLEAKTSQIYAEYWQNLREERRRKAIEEARKDFEIAEAEGKRAARDKAEPERKHEAQKGAAHAAEEKEEERPREFEAKSRGDAEDQHTPRWLRRKSYQEAEKRLMNITRAEGKPAREETEPERKNEAEKAAETNEEERTREFEPKSQGDAEDSQEVREEKLRKAREEANIQLEIARAKAEREELEKMEAERKHEVEEASPHTKNMARFQREVKEKYEAEMKAAVEQRRREDEARAVVGTARAKFLAELKTKGDARDKLDTEPKAAEKVASDVAGGMEEEVMKGKATEEAKANFEEDTGGRQSPAQADEDDAEDLTAGVGGWIDKEKEFPKELNLD